MVNLMDSGLNELKIAAEKLMNDGVLDFVTAFLKWVAMFAAIFLLILDRTSRRMTLLLVPYLFLIVPSAIFEFLRGEIGKWIALYTGAFRLLRPNLFSEWTEIPVTMFLLLVVAPIIAVETLRDMDYWGFMIGFNLLGQHVESCGGFRNSFTQRQAIPYSLGFVLIIIYPLWSLFLVFFS